MSQQGTIRRYTLIIDKISSGQHPSFAEIKDFLYEHGFEVGDRTIQRDIEQIRFEFGIELKYHRDKNGYFIDADANPDMNSFYRFLEIANTAELLTESLSESKDALTYISFDTGGGLRGIENLNPILHAIKNRRSISFSHYNFHKDKTSNYSLKPYLLKEYQNRWYVVGMVEDGFFLTFGIDRISKLKVLSETFKRVKKPNPIELFENTIGVVHSSGKVERVILSFTATQGKYIKTLPLHKSQLIIIDDDNECRIALNVIPNFELSQQILMQGDAVKVIEPKWLADEIKETLQNALSQY